MTGLSSASIGLFILLFAGVVFVYFLHLWRTVHFLLKEKPKDVIIKWKRRFSIVQHLRLIREQKKVTISAAILLFIFLVFRFFESANNQFYSLFVVTFSFAVLMLVREFGVRYYLLQDTFVVWAVHRNNYPTKEGKELVYRAIIKRHDVESIEERTRDVLVHLKDNRVVLLQGSKREIDALKKWKANMLKK